MELLKLDWLRLLKQAMDMFLQVLLLQQLMVFLSSSV
jgi:hypothetical protein